jgi:hypothetical protein
MHTWRGRILIEFCNGHKVGAGIGLDSWDSILGKSKGYFSAPQHSYRPCDQPNAHLALFTLGPAASCRTELTSDCHPSTLTATFLLPLDPNYPPAAELTHNSRLTP